MFVDVLAGWATAPVDNFGLFDLVPPVVQDAEAGGGADGAVDIDHAAAAAADHVVMVVAHPVLETRRGAGRLDPPHEAGVHQRGKRVVDGLMRDGAYVGPDGFGHPVGGGVGLLGNGPVHSQPLGGDPHTMLTQQVGGIAGHGS